MSNDFSNIQGWRQAAMTCAKLIKQAKIRCHLYKVLTDKIFIKINFKNSHLFGGTHKFNRLSISISMLFLPIHSYYSYEMTEFNNLLLSSLWFKSPRLISTNLLNGCWKWETNEQKSFQTWFCENPAQTSSRVGRWMTGLPDNPFLWTGYVMVNASGAEL